MLLSPNSARKGEPVFVECPKCGKWVLSNKESCSNCGCPRSSWLPERAKLPAPTTDERTFTMGAWGGEAIAWRVLGVAEDHLFAISECGLDCVKFNEDRAKGNDWETSDLKAWLDQTFLPQAFSDSERARIDEITCLTSLEADTCFADKRDRLCPPTDYAASRGAFALKDAYLGGELMRKGTGACHWWLRSPGMDDDDAAKVGVEGLVFDIGWPVDSKVTAVRPAIWVKR